MSKRKILNECFVGEKTKWKFMLYKVDPKTKEITLKAICKTKLMTREEMRILVQQEMAKYKYDFWGQE